MPEATNTPNESENKTIKRPAWIDELMDSTRKIVTDNADSVEEHHHYVDDEGEERIRSVDLAPDSEARNRHVFVLAIDTSNMKEEDNEEHTIVSGIQNSEAMLGNIDIVVAVLISFMKSRKVRPLLMRAMAQGMDLGGLEKTVAPRNMGELLEMLGNFDAAMTETPGDKETDGAFMGSAATEGGDEPPSTN